MTHQMKSPIPRIAACQEVQAVINLIKHVAAKQIDIRLTMDGAELCERRLF
jgi:hypothetical protein